MFSHHKRSFFIDLKKLGSWEKTTDHWAELFCLMDKGMYSSKQTLSLWVWKELVFYVRNTEADAFEPGRYFQQS